MSEECSRRGTTCSFLLFGRLPRSSPTRTALLITTPLPSTVLGIVKLWNLKIESRERLYRDIDVSRACLLHGASCVQNESDNTLSPEHLLAVVRCRCLNIPPVYYLLAATSKAGCSQEMQPSCSYGFRGEALLSLGLTSLLEIQSRCEGRDARGKAREGAILCMGGHI